MNWRQSRPLVYFGTRYEVVQGLVIARIELSIAIRLASFELTRPMHSIITLITDRGVHTGIQIHLVHESDDSHYL